MINRDYSPESSIQAGVVDTFAWYYLFDENAVSISSFSQWREYLSAIWELAGLHGLGCRDVDTALWYPDAGLVPLGSELLLGSLLPLSLETDLA